MNLIKKAELLEETELTLSQFLNEKHKAGLSYKELLVILKDQVEIVTIQSDAEVSIL